MSEPTSDLGLRALGRDAEDLVQLPDLGALERRGRTMRRRRQTGVVAAAVVATLTVGWLAMDRTPKQLEPAPTPRAATYPGNSMTDLDPGTYVLTPSLDGSEPTARVTVPEGWNAWVGPNRFDGHREGEADNTGALARSTWGIGVLVLKVKDVATQPCQAAFVGAGRELGYRQTIGAFKNLPGFRSRLVDKDRFDGHPATHLHLEQLAVQHACERSARLYSTEADGDLGTRGDLDVWVVDVRGTTLTVVEYARGAVPQAYQAELAAVTGSITFVV